MPAFSTHYIFAHELMNDIEEMADFKLNRDAVYFGTQGPDIFFFHRALPWMPGKSLRSCGSLIHKAKPEKLFECLREYNRISDNDIAKSYSYGFMLHYALDRTCHPYVYFLQDRITQRHRLTNPHTAHNTVEFAIDSYLLNRRMKIEKPALFDTSQTISDDDKVIREIGKLLEYVVPRITGKGITAKQAEAALRDTKSIQKICLDRTYLKHIIISPIECIIAPISKNFKFTAMMRPRDLEKAKKYVNIDNRVWKSPYSLKSSTKNFEDLFTSAKDEAIQMLRKYQSGLPCKEITGNISFLTGVEVK